MPRKKKKKPRKKAGNRNVSRTATLHREDPLLMAMAGIKMMYVLEKHSRTTRMIDGLDVEPLEVFNQDHSIP